VSPEDLPEVRRVLDLDGRTSLAQLHLEIARAYGLPAQGELYAFFTSGRFWDAATAHIDPRAEGRRADKSLLFRLGLSVGKTFAYLLGFENERHYLVTVQAISEVDTALAAPVLVEAAGDAPPPDAGAPEVEPTAPDEDPPELTELVALAEAFLDLDDELEPYADAVADALAHHEPWDDPGVVLTGGMPS